MGVKMHSEGRDFCDMLAFWEIDVAQYRVAAGTDLQQSGRSGDCDGTRTSSLP